MQRTVFASLFTSLIGVFAAGALHAQEVAPFSFNFGAGFVTPVQNAGTYLDTGWNLQAGGGFNFSQYLGAMLEYNYNSLGINTATLSSLGVPGGTVRVQSFTIDPIVHLSPKGPVGVYLIGGGGLYRREDQLTGFGPIGPPFSPFFGDAVLSSYSQNRPGFNVGAGVTLGTRWHAKFYAEARYNRMFTDGGDTDFIPVTFGVRW